MKRQQETGLSSPFNRRRVRVTGCPRRREETLLHRSSTLSLSPSLPLPLPLSLSVSISLSLSLHSLLSLSHSLARSLSHTHTFSHSESDAAVRPPRRPIPCVRSRTLPVLLRQRVLSLAGLRAQGCHAAQCRPRMGAGARGGGGSVGAQSNVTRTADR